MQLDSMKNKWQKTDQRLESDFFPCKMVVFQQLSRPGKTSIAKGTFASSIIQKYHFSLILMPQISSLANTYCAQSLHQTNWDKFPTTVIILQHHSLLSNSQDTLAGRLRLTGAPRHCTGLLWPLFPQQILPFSTRKTLWF